MTIKELLRHQHHTGHLMAHKFSAQIDNRTSYKGYCKITLEDYSIVGNRVVPYFEFDKLKKR